MDSRLFMMSAAMMSAMRQFPALYRGFTCVEPESGYVETMMYYLTGTETEKICPTPADLMWGIGTEVFCNLLCVVIAMLFVYALSIGNSAKQKWTTMVSKYQEWRARPSLCHHCGTVPCQVKRRSLWKPSTSRKRDKANFAERSKAMLLFNYGLELSVVLSKELPQDDLYWERKMCGHFAEEHMVLFPLCIQRQIDNWYPVPR